MSKVIEIDRGWNRIKKEIKKMASSFVKVGMLSDSGQYPTAEGGANIVDVATFNEYGTRRIPERPFMRVTFEKNIGKVVQRFKELSGSIFSGKTDTHGALVLVGDEYQGMIRKEISSGHWKPNAPSTIKRKGSSHPLIDTGRMRQSVNFEVEMKG